MRHAQTVFALLLLDCQRPTGSFVLPPAQSFFNGNRKDSPEHEPALSAELESRALKCRCVFQDAAIYRRTRPCSGVLHAQNLKGAPPASRASKVVRLRGQGEPAAETPSPQSGEASSLFSSDGVPCLRNAENGSRVVLVGVVHGKEQSVDLAEKIVREVKPDVVMLELDADRLEDMPPGSAQKSQDGLSWFTPYDVPEKAPSPSASETLSTTPKASKRGPFSFVSAPAAKLLAGVMAALESVFEEEEEDMSEMESAVREAQACGARVCLGDRDFEETRQRLVQAGLANGVDDERLDDPEALLHSSMSASGKRKFASLNLTRPGTRETARKYYAALETVCDPKALSAMISERDEVMAKNLMALGVEHTTVVALLGIFHMDGVHRILITNGWQPQEAS